MLKMSVKLADSEAWAVTGGTCQRLKHINKSKKFNYIKFLYI